MSRSQRDKGKRGELDADRLLRSLGFRPAKTEGDQERAWNGPDLAALHLEIKRAERARINDWYAQAKADAGDRMPVVLHRPSRHPWYVTLSAEDFFTIYRRSDLMETGADAPQEDR